MVEIFLFEILRFCKGLMGSNYLIHCSRYLNNEIDLNFIVLKLITHDCNYEKNISF